MEAYKKKMLAAIGKTQADATPRPVNIDDLIETVANQDLLICCLQLGIDPDEFIEEDN